MRKTIAKDKERNFFDDVIMGPDGPMYWILIYIFALFAMIPICAVSDFARKQQLETACKEWVGNDYIFDDPSCYRMFGGKVKYVDISMEKAIEESKGR